MDKEKLQRTAYEKFKLQWMMDHGITLDYIFSSAHEWLVEDPNPDDQNALEEFIEDTGFKGGMIWPCYGEFLEVEFMDVGVMEHILTTEEFEDYLRIMKKSKPCSSISINTPAGVITAEIIPDDAYPGISLLFKKEGSGEPGAIMEYDPYKGLIQLRVYSKEEADDEPILVLPMSDKVETTKN